MIEIQLFTALLAVVTAAALWRFESREAAIACIVGAAVMMLNLVAIAGVVRLMLAAGRGGGAGGLAAVAAPLKLLFTMGLFYLLMARAGLDIIGFAVGATTQFGAIMLATGRAMMKGMAGEG